MPEPVPLTDDDPAAIGGYRLLGRLGKGGQGTVYLAEPTQGEPRVAIKRLSAEALDDPRVRQRFVREAEAARQVASFCTAAVLGADFDADSPYIVSEYVEGRSLSQRVRQDGPLVGGDLNRLAVATATALVAIHEAGIVHRDFKPGNIMLSDGGARVIDFGIAQITEGSGTLTNSSIGTPAFMAPEQIAHGSATPASDVFAWGAVLVYAATGASPFDGSTVANALHNVLHAEPDLSALPDVLRPLAAAALAKDPAARPAAVDVLMGLLGRQQRPVDAADLTQAMDEARTAVLDDGTTVTARPPTQTAAPPTQAPGAPKKADRRAPRWLLGVGAVAAAIALVGAGVLLGNALGPNSAEGSGDTGGDTAENGTAGGGENEGQQFSKAEAGTWEGIADSGNRFEVRTEAEESTAALESLDDESCSTEIKLLPETEPGVYWAHIAFEGMEPSYCVDEESWAIDSKTELYFTEDTMTINFFEEDVESAPPKATLTLSWTS